MVGGYQIIDLTNISVALDGGAVAITDPKIKKQLLSLREYIEENYDFSKPLNNKLKPVMIRLRDAESGEKFEGCLWGNVSIVDDNLSFSIDAIVSVNPSKVLQINVVFEEQEDEVGNVFYGIKTATYEYKGGQDSVIVTDIKNIPSATIKKLQCGDIVLKKDSSGYHAYIVSFRNATGICLTYTDASCIETQSYDKVGQNWVYNSEDKSTLPEFAPSGTIADVLGLDSEGKLVKGSVGGGTKLYLHTIVLSGHSTFKGFKVLYSDGTVSPFEYTPSYSSKTLKIITYDSNPYNSLPSSIKVLGGELEEGTNTYTLDSLTVTHFDNSDGGQQGLVTARISYVGVTSDTVTEL